MCRASPCRLACHTQADAIRQLQEERSQLTREVEDGLSAQAELESLRAQAVELSGVTQELQQTRQTLLELQAVARQLEQHRVQIAGLADQRAELEGALQQQAELTAEVSVLQRDYDDMLDKAQRALTLQEELPKLQVGVVCAAAALQDCRRGVLGHGCVGSGLLVGCCCVGNTCELLCAPGTVHGKQQPSHSFTYPWL